MKISDVYLRYFRYGWELYNYINTHIIRIIYVYMCNYIYMPVGLYNMLYIYMNICYVYIYNIYTYMYVYTYLYIYIHIYKYTVYIFRYRYRYVFYSQMVKMCSLFVMMIQDDFHMFQGDEITSH